MTTKKEEEKFQAYREFMQWAQHLIADSIIRHGFSQLDGCLSQILNAHAALKRKYP